MTKQYLYLAGSIENETTEILYLLIKEIIKTYKQFIDEKDPANNCLDTAIITDPKLMTKQTKEKLKNIAGRVFKNK